MVEASATSLNFGLRAVTHCASVVEISCLTTPPEPCEFIFLCAREFFGPDRLSSLLKKQFGGVYITNGMRIKIASVGESVLRGKARPLTPEEIVSQRIRDLVEHMRETLSDALGVGLAAPQIGEPLQLAIIEDKAEYHANLSEEDLAERERSPVPFHVLINPQIQLVSPPEVTFFEGCLSLPGFTGIVPRARRVLVEALNHLGQPVRIEATGWYARILQHEIDHLHGTLYIDHMWSRSFSSLENYNRHRKLKTTAELRQAFEDRS
jgi:peptide deformylase